MTWQVLKRRTFLQGLAAAVPIGAAGTPLSAQTQNRIRLGGPAFVKSDDPAEFAEAHLRLGYRAAYAPGVELDDAAKIKGIIKECAARDIVIAEVGAWVNMLDPDPEKRARNIQYVVNKLALAEELAALCCVDIAGSYNPEVWYGPHPDNFSKRFFDETVENCRKIIDAVKPQRTRFSLEMMGWCLPSTPDEYLELIKAVDRKAFAVHIDVCNMINSPERIYSNGSLIKECFEKLGPWIVSCHAKDVAWETAMQVHFKEVVAGRGVLDYRSYLLGIASLNQDVPLMLEHLKTPEEYAEAKAHIVRTARNLGISTA